MSMLNVNDQQQCSMKLCPAGRNLIEEEKQLTKSVK
jgi:hypothetical protein